MMQRFIAALLLGIAMLSPARATTVLPLYLDELVTTAAVAFEGTCLENRAEREAGTNLVVTYTTFAVRDVLKGDVSMTHVIKQVGGDLDDGSPAFKIQGIPKFTPGQDYVVFLAGTSSAGFSSPIGLSQGRFTIKHEGAGRKVGNGRDFRDLTANIPASQVPDGVVQRLQRSPGPARDLDLDEFKALVRERAKRPK